MKQHNNGEPSSSLLVKWMLHTQLSSDCCLWTACNWCSDKWAGKVANEGVSCCLYIASAVSCMKAQLKYATGNDSVLTLSLFVLPFVCLVQVSLLHLLWAIHATIFTSIFLHSTWHMSLNCLSLFFGAGFKLGSFCL